MSRISIFDPDTCRSDPGARSLAWFAAAGCVCITQANIGEVKSAARAAGRNARICLHHSPGDALHEMLICQRRDGFMLPKRHGGPKSFHCLDGRLAIFTFDKNGQPLDRRILGRGHSLLYRIGAGAWHCDLPMTDYAVHMEMVAPPMGYERAPWAPWSGEEHERRAYRDKLLAGLPRVAAA
jgi:cupin fold WbuC family metalloprotein